MLEKFTVFMYQCHDEEPEMLQILHNIATCGGCNFLL